MDLRSGHPFWLIKNGLLTSYPSLKDDADCEVVVIGGGITGALVAHELSRHGVDVVVLDKRDIGSGSTSASTALLQHAADVELIDLSEKVGEKFAVRSYRLGLQAVDRLERLVSELGDDCGFERRPSLYLASRKKDVEKLKAEFDFRQKHGFDVEFLDAVAIEDRFPFAAPAAILCQGDAQVDAFRLTHMVHRNAASQGARIFDRCEVTDIQSRGDGVRITIDDAISVTAQRVVFATGYESNRYLKRKVGSLHSTFALITEPIAPFPDWPDRCLIWETARPYTYFRSTTDDRILVGGEDVPFATSHKQEGLIKAKAKTLERRFRRMFPQSEFELAYAWAGTFGSTDDGLAYIGQTDEWPNAYFALGYGGNGITMSQIAADIIADLYLGRPNADAEMFRFDR